MSTDIEGTLPTKRRRGRPPRYPLPDPEDRARIILDAALVEFAQRGYAATGMNDIARACRMTKPTIYECFSSKIDLFGALVERERSALVALLRQTYRDTAELGLWEKVRVDTAAFVHWVCENPDAFALLYLMPSPKTGLTQRAELQAEVATALVESMEKLLAKHGRSGGRSLTTLAYMATSSALGAVLASKHLLPEHAETVIDLAAGFIAAAFRDVPTDAIAAFDQVSKAVSDR
ncbi:helix-turn-helix domain-containing protein [Haloechinothrix salitolerans]|uniref:TetR/AcrR family transcriptional regulator n=1 Tax=Haloechinothrix salitolerans TaxID=926830 RepID=A0ABW2BU20_9PSEU